MGARTLAFVEALLNILEREISPGKWKILKTSSSFLMVFNRIYV